MVPHARYDHTVDTLPPPLLRAIGAPSRPGFRPLASADVMFSNDRTLKNAIAVALALLCLMLSCDGSSETPRLSDGGTGIADAGPTRLPVQPPDSGLDVFDAGPTPVFDGGTTNPKPIDAGWAGETADAGAVDPFPTDRATFFGASRCVNASLLLCEDFESGAVDKNRWTIRGGTVTVEGAEHARGGKALHINRQGNGAANIQTKKIFPAPKNTYYGRAFYKFVSLPKSAMGYAHWTIAAATGSKVTGEIRLGGQLQNNRNLFGVGTDNRNADGTGDWTNSDNDPPKNPRAVPTGGWMCLEWMHDGQNDETRFWWDGVEHPSLRTTKTMHGGNTNPFILPEFEAVWIGWDEYQQTTAGFELWVDEIALNGTRIGCSQ